MQRAQLCFHTTFEATHSGRFLLARSWLPFTLVADVVGGLVLGVGMAVAGITVVFALIVAGGAKVVFDLSSTMMMHLAIVGAWMMFA
ncbi:hypothetical protein [Amycolatopsis eburnea]|uniref:Uncharacterized protein n=1 Tax=Amycolatopsis eburnea TaxID=2267691 RepID=A0A3R9DWJ5_9PSEU|nr:hypothetical protein [Amycolatopsis eburnea]RSD13609.1 hypothetical protein EIY87_28310 [Amycolatopsis eburnea]